MSSVCKTGVFGKLPTYGDFLQRNLSSGFVDVWDGWLQHLVSVSQEQLFERWLEIYLTSPIWRFVLSKGAVDEAIWAGILIPSVDRVGRYFPFTLVRRLADDTSPANYLATNEDWYQSLEEYALAALDEELLVDELLEKLSELDAGTEVSGHLGGFSHSSSMFHVVIDNEKSEALYSLLDMVLYRNYSSYSIWTTNGSSMVEPCMISSQGLPPVSGLTSMLDGQWDARGWNQSGTMFSHNQAVLV